MKMSVLNWGTCHPILDLNPIELAFGKAKENARPSPKLIAK